MRFKPFDPASEGLEMDRVYLTQKGHEVGPFDAMDTYPEGANKDVLAGKPARSFAWQIGEDNDGDPIYASWWDTGSPGDDNATAMGFIVAREAKTIAEGMA